MPLPFGYEESVVIYQETNYGVKGATANLLLRAASFGLSLDDPAIQLTGPTGRNVGWLYDATLPRELKGIPNVSGAIGFECDFEDIGFFLKNCLHLIPTRTVLATNASTWTFNAPVDPVDMPQSLSIHLERPNLDGANGLLFLGCHINRMTFRGEPNQIVRVTMEFIGQTMIREASFSTTLSGTPWMEFHESEFRTAATPSGTPPASQGTTAGQGAPHTWEIMIENSLRQQGAAGVGKRGIREPESNGYKRFGMSFNRDLATELFLNGFIAEGPTGYFSVQLKLISDTLIPGNAAAYSFSCHFPAGRCLSTFPTSPGGPEIIQEDVAFEAAAMDVGAGVIRSANFVLENGAAATFYNDAP